MESHQGKLTSCQIDGHVHFNSRHIIVSVCRMTLQDHINKALYDFMVWPLKTSHHPTKFGSHRFCGNGDIMILVCHSIWQDQVIKRLSDFIGKSSSRLPSLVGIATMEMEL